MWRRVAKCADFVLMAVDDFCRQCVVHLELRQISEVFTMRHAQARFACDRDNSSCEAFHVSTNFITTTRARYQKNIEIALMRECCLCRLWIANLMSGGNVRQ